MNVCDEEGCKNEPDAVCPRCGLMLCEDCGGGDGNDCDQCGTPMIGM